MPRHPARRTSWAADLLRCLASLLALIALLAALPIALYVATRALLPLGLQSLGSPSDLLTQQDTGGLALLVLAAVGWIAWAQFAIATLLEIPAQLRGRTAPRIKLPGFGLSQRAAAGLIGGILILLPTAGGAFAATGAAATAPQPTSARVAATAAAVPTKQSATTASDQSSSSQSTHRTYTVRDSSPADSLWSIAEHELGDGTRWHEIADLNEGHTMVDGSIFRATGEIQPGWVLTLPGTATETDATAAATSVTVQPGDTLTAIAQRSLGDSSDWTQIANLNDGHTMTDGTLFHDPDLIRPGWKVIIPTVTQQQPGPPAAAAPAPATPVPAPAAEPATPTPATTTPATPAPATPSPAASTPQPSASAQAAATAVPTPRTATPPPAASTAPASSPTAKVSTSTPRPAPSASTQTVRTAPVAAEDSSVDIAAIASWGGLGAAGILLVLAARRMQQQRGRRRGERIRMPKPRPAGRTPLDPVDQAAAQLAEFEQRLRASEDPVGAALIDRALRTLAAAIAEQSRPLPALAAVRLDNNTLDLYLEHDSQPVRPFTAVPGSPAHWSCPVTGADLLPDDEARHVVAPYPALSTLGRTTDGATLLVDLESVGALLVAPADASQILRAMAIELATAPWRDDLGVLLAGLGEGLTALDNGYGRIQVMDSTSSALAALTAWQTTVREALAATETPTIHHARAGLTPDAWSPQIAVTATALTAEDAETIDQLLDGTCTAVLATGSATFSPRALRIPPLPGGRITLAGQTFDLVPHQVSDEDYTALLDLFGITEQPAEPEPTETEEPTEQPAPAAPPAPAPALPEQPAPAAGPAELPVEPVEPAEQVELAEPVHPVPTPAPSVPAPAEPLTAEPAPAATRTEPAAASPTGEPEHQDDEDLTLPDPAGPLLTLLGPVTLNGTDAPARPAALARMTEVAAWIALHPNGLTTDLTLDFSPGDPTATASNGQVGALRRWLGTSEDGAPRVTMDIGDGLNLHDVTVDWHHFLALTQRGTPQALAVALDLVKGRPFADTPPRRYTWAEAYRQQMIAAIVDTAAQVAEHRLAAEDPRGALAAAETGIRAEPAAEELYRLAIRAAHQVGDRTTIEHYADRLDTVLEQIGGAEMQPETAQLLQDTLALGSHYAGAPS
ncbi:LysM peptidoglycan-binding domain-containing protein [Kitasatospora kifunensis]|uniref:Nucleoid-associated protein YgaU n=1 Tax=Kitasatospora kifunensis TaxID=58351 RepID=A0A7W7RBX0_KITKI|nr:LysM peptidoglycan-binding domain-containing protein [Kitasatospora kifunensis]MBB4929137.1 nucleoid-associated protein YgaU [Kitasatospora kifunensis]